MPFRLTSPIPRLRENDVERACIDLLRYRGYWVIRQHVGRFQAPAGGWVTIGEVGLPDYATVHARYPGFLLEIKRPGGNLTPGQQRKISELKQGYQLAIAAVDTVESLAAWLDSHEGNQAGGHK